MEAHSVFSIRGVQKILKEPMETYGVGLTPKVMLSL